MESTTEQLFLRAAQAASDGHYSDATQLLEDVVQAAPAEPMPRLQLALLYLAAARLDAVRTVVGPVSANASAALRAYAHAIAALADEQLVLAAQSLTAGLAETEQPNAPFALDMAKILGVLNSGAAGESSAAAEGQPPTADVFHHVLSLYSNSQTRH